MFWKKVSQNKVNNTTNVNQNQNVQNDKQKKNSSVITQKLNNVNYEKEKAAQNQTEINTGASFDTYICNIINTTNINTIQQEFNIPNDSQYNSNFNNTYPLKVQKSYTIDNAAYQNQNEIVNQRDNRFIQEPNYLNINVNANLNVNYNIDYNYSQQ